MRPDILVVRHHQAGAVSLLARKTLLLGDQLEGAHESEIKRQRLDDV